MATTLVVRFLLGRYHATPWGRHVNEGQVEIPPSPYRLLRALYSVWKLRAPELDEAVVHALLGRLAEPPRYFVPPYRLAHTRHWYPDSRHRSGTPSTDRTLDAFAVIDRDAELAVQWPFDLPDDQYAALTRLASSLPHLGRADSLCEARLTRDWSPTSEHGLSAPLDIGEAVPITLDAATVLAPALPLDVEALLVRPVDVRAGKLLFPPQTRFVGYTRPAERTAPRRPRRASAPPVHAVRFTLTTTVLPPHKDAVALTDRLRSAAIARLNQRRGHQLGHSLLAGKGADEVRLTDHHAHAHFLALADADRRIAELVVWVAGGLAEDEFAALADVTELWPPGGGRGGSDRGPGPPTVQIRLAAYGTTSEILDDLTGPAAVWTSATPYVSPRHLKGDAEEFLRRDIGRELAHRGLPEPESVRRIEGDSREFVRHRPSRQFGKGYGSPGQGRGSPSPACLEVTFGAPVAGPLMLGYLSHFGLGLFRPVVNSALGVGGPR